MSAPAPMSLQLAVKEALPLISLFKSLSTLHDVLNVAVRAEADEKRRAASVAALTKHESALSESVAFLATKEAEAHAAATVELATVKEALAEQLAKTTASAKELVDGCKAECDALKADVAADLKKTKAKVDALKLTVTARVEELAALDDKIATAREAMRKLLA